MTFAPARPRGDPSERRPIWPLLVAVAVLTAALTAAALYQLDAFGGSSSPGTRGSGKPATQVRDVGAFASVELSGSNNVVIHSGKQQSVIVRADDNLIEFVTTEVQSGRLVIGNEGANYTTRAPMSVEVSVPGLSALTLSGSGNIVVDGIDGDSTTVSLPGSGNITASGVTQRLDVTISGSGSAQLRGLKANDVRAIVSGVGNIQVIATHSLDALVSGTGAINYGGNPTQVAKSVTGTGAITAGQ
ncbi:MAG TPA: head GIN domain-containing protein [Dehalococcoidia bacterium]|jgi:hypothetical protein